MLVVSAMHCIITTRAILYGTTFAFNCSMLHLSSQNAKTIHNFSPFYIVHGCNVREVYQKAVFKVIDHVCSSRKQVVPYRTEFLFLRECYVQGMQATWQNLFSLGFSATSSWTFSFYFARDCLLKLF